jgi:MFS family permease
MIGALLAYSAFFLIYLLPMPTPLFVVVRLLHGAAGGAFAPAAYGLVAQVTAPKQRGQAYGMMQSTNMAGMLVGPAIGGFIALFSLNAIFIVAAAVCLLSTLAVWAVPNARVESSPEAPVSAFRLLRTLVPLIILGAGTSYLIGTFDTIWSLYMSYRGASTFEVGISFAAFALPATLVSAQAGALGDRFGAVRMVSFALVGTAVFASIYPFVTSVPWLIGLGLIEGALTVGAGPSLVAEVSRAALPGQQGRTQGLFQAVQTGLQIVGSLAGGALYTFSPTYAFLAMTGVCLVGAVSPLFLYRRGRRPSPAHILEPPPSV